MRAALFVILLAGSVSSVSAGDVLASGNSFDTSNEAFTTNLAQLAHTFQFVPAADLATTDLTGFSTVWLDGFSSYPTLPTAALEAFVAAGGTLLVQHPGFGGNPLADYPFAADLAAVYRPEENPALAPALAGHPVLAGLTADSLSNWLPAASAGYFSATGDHTVLVTAAAGTEAVTLEHTAGTGRAIYTHQLLSQALAHQVLDPGAGPLLLADNLFGLTDAPALTPPLFVHAGRFSRDGDGALHGLLPDPNADGLDAAGTLHPAYALTLVVDGAVVHTVPAVTGPWPAHVTVAAADVPDGPYFIGLARTAAGLPDSAPLLLNGPEAAATDPGLARRYRRWLTHLPRQAGGFSGIVRLRNPDPTADADVALVAFETDGSEGPTETVTVPAGARLDLALYGAGADGLFGDPALLDTLSHLALFDPSGNVAVSLRYQADISGFGFWVDALDLDARPSVGRLFLVDGATPNQGYYDGVAVLNPTSALTPEIVVRRYDASGAPAGTLSLGTLAPGAKRTSALSFAFPDFVPNPTYEVEALGTTGAESIAVLGLSGNTDGSFFATAAVTRLK